MLIHHYFRPTRWLLALPAGAAALVSYGAWQQAHPEGLTGGSTAGLWFGLAGLGCLVWAFFVLPPQRQSAALRHSGRRRSYWLQGHLWLSLLGVVLILCHTGMCQGGTRFGGRLETVLMLIFALTLATGVFGAIVQHWLPSRISRLDQEIPLGQAPKVCQVWRRQADELVEKIAAGLDVPGVQEFQEVYRGQVRTFLTPAYPSAADRALASACRPLQNHLQTVIGPLEKDVQDKPAKKDLEKSKLAEKDPERIKDIDGALQKISRLQESRDKVKQVEDLLAICAARRALARQQRLHWWLHGWLLLHVPLAVAFLFLAAVHALVSVLF